MKDFRAIGLVNGVYKIISKVLCQSYHQAYEEYHIEASKCFCQGKQILDSVLITNECLEGRIKVGVPDILCKLDNKKTCEHFNWEFLFYLVGRCSFGVR